MMRMIGFSVLVIVAGLSSGCATCCAPFDYHYLAQTGRWVRYNPTTGRVGSAFDNAGGQADAMPVSGEIVTTTEREPTPAQQQEVPSQPQTMPSQPQTVPMQPRMSPGYQGNPLPAPSRVPTTGPQTRSVIPRNMGETYLPRGM
jgi:hypothetical protein